MRRVLLLLTTTLALGQLMATPAFAYDFPSTNEQNLAENWPHVIEIDDGLDYVTLQFVNPTNTLAFFEIRIDGLTPETYPNGNPLTPHPVVLDDVSYPGLRVDGRDVPKPVIRQWRFEAEAQVEVRLALGGDRFSDFDWTPFYVYDGQDPRTREEAKHYWEEFGFKNQGHAVRFVETGEDSR